MIIDWKASKEAWINEVRDSLIPHLTNDTRFPDATRIVSRFDAAIAQWRRSNDFRPVINDANELAAAAEILRDLRAADQLLYEPKLIQTRKSIDFGVLRGDGGRSWIDMKTVAPGWQDDEAAWNRITQIADAAPNNTRLILDRNFSGAAIGGQWLKARWSFVQRAVELEAKIAQLTETERGPVRLLLCSEGAWHQDDLEDFADFYHSGCFRADDWAQNAIALYMAERNIKFSGTIAGFCYLERKHEDATAQKFAVDVRGPKMFAPVDHVS
jgi:hypothetical protein